MSSYWMLLTDDSLDLGAVVPNVQHAFYPNGAVSVYPNAAVINPRAVPFLDTLHGRVSDDLADLVCGHTPRVRVAQVRPAGAVRGHTEIWDDTDPAYGDLEIDETLELESAGGWIVESIEPLHSILGPQGELVVTAVQHALRIFDAPGDRSLADAYHHELSRLHEDRNADRLKQANRAVGDALEAIGTDVGWWEDPLAAVWGRTELIALAARDLIGTTPSWTQDAYDLLTQPWRRALPHPLHPQDPPLDPAVAQ